MTAHNKRTRIKPDKVTMNPEPNLKHEQPPPPPPPALVADMPSAAMASPSSSSSTSSIGSKSSKASLVGEDKTKDAPRAGGGDDLSTPPLIGKVGGVPPAVAAAVSSYVLPKVRKVRRSAKKRGDDADGKPRRPLSGM
jgi:hypothetical protein